jgi:hypothetical protein
MNGVAKWSSRFLLGEINRKDVVYTHYLFIQTVSYGHRYKKNLHGFSDHPPTREEWYQEKYSLPG